MDKAERLKLLSNMVAQFVQITTGYTPSAQISNEFAMKILAEAHQNNKEVRV